MKRTMIKQKILIVTTLILLFCLTACTNRVMNDNMTNEEAVDETIEEAETENIEENTATEEDTIEETETNDLQADRTSMIEAYTSILKGVYTNHSFPDGNDYGFDETYNSSDNKFAIYDIDQDGKDELIIEYVTTAMAGMTEKIYGFNASTNAASEEFSEFPNLTYYDNGVIEAGWSHNQGFAGEFWPYTLYQYNAESDTYAKIGMVDAWDKSLSEKDYDGNPFPVDSDKNGDGIVYYIMPGDNYLLDKPVDLDEYNLWHDSYVGGAGKVDVPYVSLNEVNINGIK